MVTIEQIANLKPFEFEINFNEHKGVHDKIESYYDREDFISEDEYRKCIETGNVFQGRIYPNNSVGFYIICANECQKLLDSMHEIMIREGEQK